MKNVCCICHKEYSGWGNNPEPVVSEEEGRCCDACNWDWVIPARLDEMVRREASDGKQLLV